MRRIERQRERQTDKLKRERQRQRVKFDGDDLGKNTIGSTTHHFLL